MNNTLRALFAFSTLGLSTLCASQIDPMRVSVPFAFTAGSTTLPAGEYTVSEQTSNIIMIRGTHGSVIVLGSAADGMEDRSGLSFSHTEKGYVLKSVKAVGRPASLVPVMATPEK